MSSFVSFTEKAGFLLLSLSENTVYKLEVIRVCKLMALITSFVTNLIIIIIISRFLYYHYSRRKDFYFTYVLVGSTVFLICYLLENIKLELGFALGLFAVFGILRYRTTTIPIKEMTFLFIIIGVSVINAIAGDTLSIAELAFANLSIILIIWLMEGVWATNGQEARKTITYENLELVKPENVEALKNDLEAITGLDILRVEVGSINFKRKTAKVTVIYREPGVKKT